MVEGQDSGHVFVVHGLLEAVRYDVVVVPTDSEFNVESRWKALLTDGTPRKPDDWGRGYGRSPDTDQVWFISVHDRAPVTGDQLGRRIEAMVGEILDANRSSENKRVVIAMPVLGIGGGAQGSRRGSVVRELLQCLTDIARAQHVDLALVTSNLAVHSAAQHFRREDPRFTSELTDAERASAKDLGMLAQQGHLALFIGAGVSMAAGLPSWDKLLKDLAREANIADADFKSLADSPLDQAELVWLNLQERLGPAVVEMVAGAEQVSLAHALLAGLNAGQVVTTNYDELYEHAVESTGRPRPAVLPREQAEPDRAWLLKMHGDIADEQSIVLTRRSFVRYDANSRPAGSLLQSLMMTKHLLVVGTSMSDDNVIRLAVEVDDFLKSDAQFGTFLDVSAPSARTRLWEKRFRWLNCCGDDIAARVRRMEIFLDAVGMYAAKDASWLLDERFSGLLEPGDEDIAKGARRISQRIRRSTSTLLWPLRDRLDDLGAGE